jgi:hypothetical protein
MSPRRFPVPWIIRPLRLGAGYEVRMSEDSGLC